jgi:ParB-like chromosome segregation protein Spo0J
LVRPLGDAFQIVAGHHRKAAVGLAGLVTVPCWVREMDDDEAFMALVLANSQSELLPLERGMHALKATEQGKHGKSVEAYAKACERKVSTVKQEVWAAKVAARAAISAVELVGYTRHLAEVHATPEWLWPALVARLIAEGWNVDTARGHAGRLKDLPRELPTWIDREALAQAIVDGTARSGDLARMVKIAKDASDRIERAGFLASDYRQELQDRLDGERPGSVLALQAIVDAVTGARADAKRRQEQEEEEAADVYEAVVSQLTN